MHFVDYFFMIYTKAAPVRVHLEADVFYCLCDGTRGQDEESIATANLSQLREIVADKILARGFRPGVVKVSAMDLEP